MTQIPLTAEDFEHLVRFYKNTINDGKSGTYRHRYSIRKDVVERLIESTDAPITMYYKDKESFLHDFPRYGERSFRGYSPKIIEQPKLIIGKDFEFDSPIDFYKFDVYRTNKEPRDNPEGSFNDLILFGDYFCTNSFNYNIGKTVCLLSFNNDGAENTKSALEFMFENSEKL